MSYSSERIVTVASVKITEQESALISAWCKLAGTKVEAVASDLMKFFILYYVKLDLVPQPTSKDMVDVITSFSNTYNSQNEHTEKVHN